MRKVLGAFGLIGLTVLPAGSSEPLRLALTPSVAFAPATMRIRASIEPNADNRRLTIVADGSNFYRSSEVQLDGDQAPKTLELFFKDVPGGEYEVFALLTDASGHQRTARSSMKVIARFGGE